MVGHFGTGLGDCAVLFRARSAHPVIGEGVRKGTPNIAHLKNLPARATAPWRVIPFAVLNDVQI